MIALMGAAAVLYVGGIVNLLWPVTAAVFLCILIGLIVTVKKGRSRGMSFAAALRLKEYFDPLVILHAISCLVFTVIFRVSEPLFYYWDEIAFWGTSAKSVKLMDRLYSVWPTTLHNHLPPANALLSYFFSFFAADFQPYFLLLSYAFLFFAVYAAVAELAYRKSGSLPFAVATYILLVLSPFMCVAHKEGLNYQTLLYAYGTAMVDFNIAVVFLSIVVLYLRNPAGKWYLLPCIFLVNMKNTGAFFAVLAMCVVVCFTLFDAQAKKRIRKAVKTGGIMLAVIAISYASWFVHLNAFEPKAVQQVVLQDKAYLLQQQEEPVRPDKAVGRNVLSIVVPSLPPFREL